MNKLNINRKFPPLYFNDSPVNDLLKDSESRLMLLFKTEKSKELYKTFNDDFQLYLSKLPTSPAKTFVTDIFNRDLVYIGQTTSSKTSFFYSRVLLTETDKLAGVVLNSSTLGINVNTGQTNAIDDAIYAVYHGLIRATTILNKRQIKRDKKLNELLTTYLFLLFLKLLGKSMNISVEKKHILHIICVYLYYKQFFKDKHESILLKIKREYVSKNIISEEFFNKVESKASVFKSATSFKDIPFLLKEFEISTISSSQFFMTILKHLKQQGFYSIIGSLDNLISSIILSKYPSSIVSKFMMTNPDVHKEIESILNSYMNKIKFDIRVATSPK